MEEKLKKWWEKVTYRKLKFYFIISCIVTILYLASILIIDPKVFVVSWVAIIIFSILVVISFILLCSCLIKKFNEEKERIYKDQLLQIEEVFGDKERIEAKCFVEFDKKNESLTLYIVVDGNVAKEFKDFPHYLFLEYFGNISDEEEEEQ